jgi:two-component system chemotaxis sensor kinase CheA
MVMTSDEPDAIDGASSEFIAEIKEDLASLEPNLLAMEEKGTRVDDALIHNAFRSIHSIKGGAGFINFKELSSLSHVMENVLMLAREKKLEITSDIVDALLAGFDAMKLMVDQIGSQTPIDCHAQESTLQKIVEENKFLSTEPVILPAETSVNKKKKASALKTDTSLPSSRDEAPKAADLKNDSIIDLHPLNDSLRFKNKMFPVSQHRFERARAGQKFIYAIHIRIDPDAGHHPKKLDAIVRDITSIGEVLYSDLDTDNFKAEDLDFFCVVATILDLPLISQVLDVNTTQVAQVARKMQDGQLEPDPFLSVSAPEKDRHAKEKDLSDKPAIFKADKKKDRHSQAASFTNSQTIRINVDLLTRLMNQAGELVLSRNQLRPVIEALPPENHHALGVMHHLDAVTTDLQATIMQMRMQPIGDLISKYKRVIRDIARRMSKKVDFVMEGADVEVDRNILEKLANPLTHLIRNCIDHGIEMPNQRKKMGKPEAGSITIQTTHQGGYVHIRISDDGAGIDPQLVLTKAFDKGLVSEALVGTLTQKQKMELIFLPGFSTSDEITDISGRGVGMDVVKTNVERLRGQIDIESVQGQGTCIHLIIPLTLAIVPSMIVGVSDARFAIPQVNVKEMIYLEPGQIHSKVEKIAGAEVLKLRNQLIPVIRLRNVLSVPTFVDHPDSHQPVKEKRKAIAERRSLETDNKPSDRKQPDMRCATQDRRKNQWDAMYVVILKLGSHHFGLCVDVVYDSEEVVVEPLDHYLKHLKYYAGATVLGDGRVTMILDVPGIAAEEQLNFDALPKRPAISDAALESRKQDAQQSDDLIVFGHNSNEFFALPLAQISRLEQVTCSEIHHSGGQAFYDRNGQVVPLFSLDMFLSVSQIKPDTDMCIIFPKHTEAPLGIMVSQVLDTIKMEAVICDDTAASRLVTGKMFVDNQMIQVLDHDRFFAQVSRQAARLKE